MDKKTSKIVIVISLQSLRCGRYYSLPQNLLYIERGDCPRKGFEVRNIISIYGNFSISLGRLDDSLKPTRDRDWEDQTV